MRVILDSPHWTNALLLNGSGGGTLTGGRLKSPLRDLIENMPEEAAHVLGKCITGSDHAATDSDDFEVTETLTDRVDAIVNLHLSVSPYRCRSTTDFSMTRIKFQRIIR